MAEFQQALFNLPQYRYLLILARITVILWGRATGKTTGPVTSFIYDNAQKMPRSLGGWVVPTYEKVLTQMIPNLKRGLANLGLMEDRDYVIGKFFDKRLNVKKPYTCPLKPHYFVHFKNGSGFVFISLDRASTMGNGLDLDWLLIDEAKMCPYDKVKEVMMTLRGNETHFGHLSNHKSMMIASDKPTSSKGKWLFEYAKEVNEQQIELIVDCALYLEKLKTAYDNSNSKQHKTNLKSKIKKWTMYLNALRKDAVYVSEASTFENICNIGVEAIRNFKKILSDIDFQVSVANKTLYAGHNAFYPHWSEEQHGYYAPVTAHVDTLRIGDGHRRDCRWDSDLKHSEALDIAFDHNNAINWIVVGQGNDKEYKLLKSMYVCKPKYIDDLIDEFCKYYEAWPVKRVHYYYNHTSKRRNSMGDPTEAERVMARLRAQKWTVIERYYGKEPSHWVKFNFFMDLLKGESKEKKLPVFKFNLNNNEDLNISMQSAQSKQGKDGFEKDKTSERDKEIPPQHATHGSEALDCLMIGKFQQQIKSKAEFTDNLVLGGAL